MNNPMTPQEYHQWYLRQVQPTQYTPPQTVVSQKPKGKKKKPKPKGLAVHFFIIIGVVIILIAAMILYAEYKKGSKEVKMPDARVLQK